MKLRKHTHGLSLLKRRTWYADADADDSADEDAPEPAPKAERKGDLSTAPTEDLLAEIKALRKENAERRKRASELETWKAQQESAKNQAEEGKLLEEKKFQELLSKREQELATIQSELAKERMNNLKMKVGLELNVPKSLVYRLQGDTEEALLEDAKSLIAELKLNQQPQADEKTQKPPARSQTTTVSPDGNPLKDSPEARRKARAERVPPIFQAGPVRFVNKSDE